MTDSILPYDRSSEFSIIKYAGKLTNHTLHEIMGEMRLDVSMDVTGNLHSKGYFGQLLERGYFLIDNNSNPAPDFEEAGLELKTAPLKRNNKNRLVSKERMVLGIIDYNRVPEEGFNTFLKKNSHLLLVFFEWVDGQSILDYRIDKVVDWKPSDNELRVIREDWDTIERFVMEGRAHELSERFTLFLAASRKGAGGDGDYRSQPFSDAKAKQRALSFKPSFVNDIYRSREDVNKNNHDIQPPSDDSILTDWDEDDTFEMHILKRFSRFTDRNCWEIEEELGIELSDRSKSYYRMLTNRILGVHGNRVKEFEQSNIMVKTMRLDSRGIPKESMSFPAFDYAEIVAQDWEDSDLYDQINRKFLFVVFAFPDRNEDVPRKDLVFRSAFFWSVPDDDVDIMRWVWTDTREKIRHKDFGNFTRHSDGHYIHVRDHGANSRDTVTYDGEELKKLCFWFNKDYLRDIVQNSMYGRSSSSPRDV